MVHSALKEPVEEEMEHCLTQADLRISEETFMIKKTPIFSGAEFWRGQVCLVLCKRPSLERHEDPPPSDHHTPPVIPRL